MMQMHHEGRSRAGAREAATDLAYTQGGSRAQVTSSLTLSRLLLDLHQPLPGPGLHEVRACLLARLSETVPFTSAAWASGTMTPGGPDFHTVSLWRQPPELLQDYERLKHLDPLFVESARQPGVPVRASARTSLPHAFMPYVERYGLEQAMSTMHIDPRSALLTGITVWRDNPLDPFTAEDAAVMEATFPHLMEVLSRHALGLLEGRVAAASSRAAVDSRGRLHYADGSFAATLASEFPAWVGPDLPEPLAAAVAAGVVHRLGLTRLTVHVEPRGELTYVRLRPRTAVDDLTARQREIVDLIARGLTHKDIAVRLHIAPTTVRNHIAHAYQRLRVGNRVELTALLRGSE